MTHRREENNFFVLGNQNDTLDTKELYMLFDPTPSTCPLVSCCIKTTIPHSWYIFPINSLTTFLYFFSSNSFSLKICSILIYSTLWGADPIEHWYYSVSNPFFFSDNRWQHSQGLPVVSSCLSYNRWHWPHWQVRVFFFFFYCPPERELCCDNQVTLLPP